MFRHPQPGEQTRDRVADFVDKTSAFAGGYGAHQSSQSSITSEIIQRKQYGHASYRVTSAVAADAVQYTFSMDSRLREMFLTLFAYTQDLDSGKSLFA